MTTAPPQAPAEARIVLLFRSIHDVMRAETTLGARAVWCDMVPVPRALSAECGMAIEVRRADWPIVAPLREAAALGWIAAWAAEGDGYVPVAAPSELPAGEGDDAAAGSGGS